MLLSENSIFKNAMSLCVCACVCVCWCLGKFYGTCMKDKTNLKGSVLTELRSSDLGARTFNQWIHFSQQGKWIQHSQLQHILIIATHVDGILFNYLSYFY